MIKKETFLPLISNQLPEDERRQWRVLDVTTHGICEHLALSDASVVKARASDASRAGWAAYDLVIADAEALQDLGWSRGIDELARLLSADGLLIVSDVEPVEERVSDRLDWLAWPPSRVYAGRGSSIDLCPGPVFEHVVQPPTLPVLSLTQRSHDRRRRRMVRVELGDRLLDLGGRLRAEFGAAPMRRVSAGLEMAAGVRPLTYADPAQRPALFFLPDVPAAPWANPREHDQLRAVTDALEADWHVVRSELDAVRAGVVGGPERYLQGAYMTTKFAGTPSADWENITLWEEGRPSAALGEMPRSSKLVRRLAPAISGDVLLSVLRPGSELAPHVDDNNYKLTLHLGLRVPEGASIAVNGIERRWSEGECLVFSDAYVHAVHNHGAHARECLLIDLWHWDISEAERSALRRVRQVLEPASSPAVFDRF